jgi:hypothetical protein
LFLNGKKTYSFRSFRRDSTLDRTRDTVNLSSIRFSTTESRLETGRGTFRLNQVDVGYNLRVFFDLGGVFITGFYSESLKSFYRANYTADFKHRYLGGSIGIWLNNKKLKQQDTAQQ